MGSKSRLVLLISIIISAAIIMGPVGGASQVARAADANTLTVAFSQEPDSLNVYYTNMAFAIWAVYLGEANLWDYDDKQQPAPVQISEVPNLSNGDLT